MKTNHKHPLSIFIFLVCFVSLFAQQDIRLDGLVVMQNSKYKTGKVEYISDVSIRAPFSIPTKSDSRGYFGLVFSDKPLGNTIPISARKSGLKVVNEKVLEAAAVLGRVEGLKVVMCPEETFEENLSAYYNISQNAVKRTYERRMAVFQKGSQAEQRRLMDSLRIEMRQVIGSKEKAISILEEQRQELEKQVKELADRFVVINLDDESAIHQAAFEAFAKGDVNTAISVLNRVNWHDRLKTNKDQMGKRNVTIQELKQQNDTSRLQIEKDRRSCILAASLYQLQYRFDSVQYFYELAIEFDLDSTDIDVINNYTKLLFDYRQLNKALIYNDIALSRLQTLRSAPDSVYYTEGYIMALYHRQMILARSVEKSSETERVCRSLIPLLEQFEQSDSSKYIKTAMVYANLGQALHYQDKDSLAVEPYQKSLNILKTMGRYSDSTTVRFNKYVSSAGLASVMRELSRLDTALVLSKQAVETMKNLVEKTGSIFYMTYYAQSLNTLALIYDYKQQYEQAIETYKKALFEGQKGTVFNPIFSNIEMVRTLTNISGLYCKMDSLDLSELYIDSAQRIVTQYLSTLNTEFEEFVVGIIKTRRLLCIAWLQRNQNAKAEMNGLMSYKLLPDNTSVKVFYALSLIFNNKIQEAEDILKTVKGHKSVNSSISYFQNKGLTHPELDRIRQVYGQ